MLWRKREEEWEALVCEAVSNEVVREGSTKKVTSKET